CRDRAPELRKIILEVHGKQRNVGLQVAVRLQGALVFSEGFGFADLEHGVAVDPRTRLPVASVTKAITGLALVRALERGEIELDVPIQRYLPDFPRKPEGGITVRLLAAHLAGIRHWANERTPELYARHFEDVGQ